MKMRTIFAILVASSSAYAQMRGAGARGVEVGKAFPLFLVLNTPTARAELGLKGDQSQKFWALYRRPEFGNVSGGRPNDAQMRAMDEEVTTILTPGQLQRLRELRVQYYGPSLLADKELAARLKLTPAQTKKVAAAVNVYDSEIGALQAKAPKREDREKFRAFMMGFRAARAQAAARRDAALLAILTPAQRASWVKMGGTAVRF